jgi:hypothetical protein
MMVLVVPMAASAATYLLRPNNTTSLQSGWSVTPGTSTADAVLNKPVAHPTAPSTSSYVTAGPGSTNYYAGVSVSPAPTFQTGETLQSTTAWAYLNTVPSQPMVVSLWRFVWFAGYQQVGATTVPAGSPAGWYSVATQTQLNTFDLHNLSIGLQPTGTGSGSRVYAAYVEVDTNDPSQSPSTPSAPSAPTVSTSPVPTVPTTVKSNSPLAPISLAVPVIKLAPTATSISVPLKCAPGTPHGCTGELVLTLTASPPAKASAAGRPRAVTARCARGCRVLGHTKFSIVAGGSKKVKVHLAHSASRLFHGRHSVNLLATTTMHDGAGHTQTSTVPLTVDQSSARPKPGTSHRQAPKSGSQDHPQGAANPTSGAKSDN